MKYLKYGLLGGVIGLGLFYFFPVFPVLLSDTAKTSHHFWFFSGKDFVYAPLTSFFITAYGGLLGFFLTIGLRGLIKNGK